jgi:hypothetical protein
MTNKQKKEQPKTVTAFEISVEDLQSLQALAHAQDRSVSSLLRLCVRQMLESTAPAS